MVAALRWVLSPSSYENFAVICLYRTESNGDIEVDVEQLTWLLIDVDQVVVNGTLVKFEIVNPVSSLPNALTIITEARATINLRDSSLHEVTLTAYELASWTISHWGYSGTECASILLRIRSWVVEVFIDIVFSLVTSTIVVIWSLRVRVGASTHRCLIAIKVLTVVVISLAIELPAAILVMLLSSWTTISSASSIAVVVIVGVVASTLIIVLWWWLVIRVAKVVSSVTAIFVIELLLLHENTI